jgi:DEAD/DEAH box helicase domain-containing protein
MKILFYDCEIIKCLPDRLGARKPGFEYCDGWRDFQNMGISCIGYSSGLNGELIASIAPFEDFSAAFEGAIIIGFNSRDFDDNLCAANGIEISTHYDLLEEVRIAAYGSISWKNQPKGYSYSLGAIGEANGFPKTGSGALAPELWQQGKYQEVLDYCLNDVALTRHLFKLGLTGKLIDPNTGHFLKLANPFLRQ